MSRVKYVITNLALISLVITLACMSHWAIVVAALWQSFLASYAAFVWYNNAMNLLPSNYLTIMVPIFALPLLCILPIPLYTPNFLILILQIFIIFHNLFDYVILLTPLKSYFIIDNLPVSPPKYRVILHEDQPMCKICFETIDKDPRIFYLPNSSKMEKQAMATHSLLCEDCYHEYPNKDKDLVHTPSDGWHSYIFTSPA
jgi:hypothetical protein